MHALVYVHVKGSNSAETRNSKPSEDRRQANAKDTLHSIFP